MLGLIFKTSIGTNVIYVFMMLVLSRISHPEIVPIVADNIIQYMRIGFMIASVIILIVLLLHLYVKKGILSFDYRGDSISRLHKEFVFIFLAEVIAVLGFVYFFFTRTLEIFLVFNVISFLCKIFIILKSSKQNKVNNRNSE